MSTNEEKQGWLVGLFTGWGVPASWAKFIAGAIIGGFVAIGALSASGCSAVIDQTTEDGTFHYEGVLVLPNIIEGGK